MAVGSGSFEAQTRVSDKLGSSTRADAVAGVITQEAVTTKSINLLAAPSTRPNIRGL